MFARPESHPVGKFTDGMRPEATKPMASGVAAQLHRAPRGRGAGARCQRYGIVGGDADGGVLQQ